MSKLKPEIKQKWIEALRSGKYKQGRGRLRSSNDGGFCCLGVLLDVCFDGEWITSRDRHFIFAPKSGQRMSIVLSPFTRDQIRLRKAEEGNLADMNDNGSSFEVIAKYIEENL